MKRLFQFRSAERDAQTDRERVGVIARAIATSIADAQAERKALVLRVKEARDLASFAAGTDSDEYLSREAKDQSRIGE